MDKATGLPVVTDNADGAITDDDLKAFAEDLSPRLGFKTDAGDDADGVTTPTTPRMTAARPQTTPGMRRTPPSTGPSRPTCPPTR